MKRYATADEVINRYLHLLAITRHAAPAGLDYERLAEAGAHRGEVRPPPEPGIDHLLPERWRLDKLFGRLYDRVGAERWGVWVLKKIGRLTWSELRKHPSCPVAAWWVDAKGEDAVALVDRELSSLIGAMGLYLPIDVSKVLEWRREQASG